MEQKRFWELVEKAKQAAGDDLEGRIDALRDVLMGVPLEDVIGFEQVFADLMAESYEEALWGAAYLLNGGCSDDGFEYFRVWLISEGEGTFRRSLANPDSLAELGMEDLELELYWYVPRKVYQERTGTEMPEVDRKRYPELTVTWDEDDLPERFPRIAELVA